MHLRRALWQPSSRSPRRPLPPLFAVTASATPPATLTATYTVASQAPTSVRTAGANTFVTLTETATLTGV